MAASLPARAVRSSASSIRSFALTGAARLPRKHDRSAARAQRLPQSPSNRCRACQANLDAECARRNPATGACAGHSLSSSASRQQIRPAELAIEYYEKSELVRLYDRLVAEK